MEQLIAAVNAGSPVKYLFFWGHTRKAGADLGSWVFSQWFPAPFEVDGERFATAEHWMMAGKAALFGDDEMRARILQSGSPKEAKALGRQVRGFDDAAWSAHRFDLVVRGNVHKFASREDFRSYLLGTGARVLVEAAPRDRIWGIGLGAERAANTHPSGWRGQNLLGFALMEARDRLA